MSAVAERWLLVEELIAERKCRQREVECTSQVQDLDTELDNFLSVPVRLSNVEDRNQQSLASLKVSFDHGTTGPNNDEKMHCS